MSEVRVERNRGGRKMIFERKEGRWRERDRQRERERERGRERESKREGRKS